MRLWKMKDGELRRGAHSWNTSEVESTWFYGTNTGTHHWHSCSQPQKTLRSVPSSLCRREVRFPSRHCSHQWNDSAARQWRFHPWGWGIRTAETERGERTGTWWHCRNRRRRVRRNHAAHDTKRERNREMINSTQEQGRLPKMGGASCRKGCFKIKTTILNSKKKQTQKKKKTPSLVTAL